MFFPQYPPPYSAPLVHCLFQARVFVGRFSFFSETIVVPARSVRLLCGCFHRVAGCGPLGAFFQRFALFSFGFFFFAVGLYPAPPKRARTTFLVSFLVFSPPWLNFLRCR